MLSKRKGFRMSVLAVLACVTVLALGMDMTIALPAKITRTFHNGFWGVVHNLLVSLNAFHTMDHLTGAIAAAGMLIAYRRWLLQPCRSSVGEYLLSGFFALSMLVSEACAAENSIKAIWAGGTQLLKSAILLMGMWPMFLAALRALREGMQRLDGLKSISSKSKWGRHPFLYPFLLMAVCWLPVLIMKHPGGMSPDVTMQVQDWMNQNMELSHPPVTSVVYGVFYEMGQWLGGNNNGIFLFTLLQTLCYLAVLAYSCSRMLSWRVPAWVYGSALFIYCIAPNYSGWTTTLVKDVPYVIACNLLCILMIDLSLDPKAFCSKVSHWIMLVIAGTTVWLWRRNGIGMTLVCGLCMLVVAVRRTDLRCVCKTAVSLLLTIAISLGINAALTSAFPYRSAAKREVYSHFLQAAGRVAVEYPDAYTDEEIAVINEVMTYDQIPRRYDPIITDGVKLLFKEDATPEEYKAFCMLVMNKAPQYATEYLDAYINLTYRLFDWRADRGDYVARREISHPYYIRSYTNLLYDQEELQGLNAAQEAAENWHFWFADLPLIGLMVNIGFCVDLMLALVWVMIREKRKHALMALVPALLTAVFCLASPVVYIRYALPITSTLPLWFAAYAAHGQMNKEEKS